LRRSSSCEFASDLEVIDFDATKLGFREAQRRGAVFAVDRNWPGGHGSATAATAATTAEAFSILNFVSILEKNVFQLLAYPLLMECNFN
jgi:hypothetical protein